MLALPHGMRARRPTFIAEDLIGHDCDSRRGPAVGTYICTMTGSPRILKKPLRDSVRGLACNEKSFEYLGVVEYQKNNAACSDDWLQSIVTVARRGCCFDYYTDGTLNAHV